jgi:aminoglycoside phosphotransferase (APT) family kinase protein
VAALGALAETGRVVSRVPAVPMHDDELDIDVELARRLLSSQFPGWAYLPLAPVLPAGTDHAIFRLGGYMSVRLPRRDGIEDQADLEQEWLPRLAPHLPLALPAPLAIGMPDDGYPFRWAVHTWVEGRPATRERVRDPGEAASDLARFVLALQQVDSPGAPAAGRGAPLATRDRQTRIWIATLAGVIDTGLATAMWKEALAAPVWDGPPLWVHGDLDSRNLLARDGRLAGLVDFGGLGVGDPACDVGTAWKMLSGEARDRFRAELDVDDATWARARGHVLSQSLGALSYYTLANNAVLVLEARRWLSEVLADR